MWSEVLVSHYAWLKGIHIFSAICWMAALLYLPRLFVYHAECGASSPQGATFEVMERRLTRTIMHPSAVATWLSGAALAGATSSATQGWFVLKLSLLVVMTGLHLWLSRERRRIAETAELRSPRAYRTVNEIPAILAAAIVLLATVKPF